MTMEGEKRDRQRERGEERWERERKKSMGLESVTTRNIYIPSATPYNYVAHYTRNTIEV